MIQSGKDGMRQPIIGLITDFGTEDGYVGALKGRILSAAPTARVIDISHSISPYNIRQGAFCLNNSYPTFPDKTIFVAVVDPGVGTHRDGLIVNTSQHLFVGPDNGLFSYVFYREGYKSFVIDEDILDKPVSPTFHGRDVFARVAARLANGEAIENLSSDICTPHSFIHKPDFGSNNTVQLEVIHVDHFGNLIFNFTRKDWMDAGSKAPLTLSICGQKLGPPVETFGSVGEGEFALNWDSSDFLQVILNKGHAASNLNIKTGQQATLNL